MRYRLVSALNCFIVAGGFERSNGIVYQQVLDRFNGSATATAWVTSIFSTLRLILGKFVVTIMTIRKEKCIVEVDMLA